MDKPVRAPRERDPSPPSLLIAAHCSTVRRKSDRIDIKELSAILDDFVRELNSSPLRLTTYLNSLNESVKTLNATFPPALLRMPSHYFFTLVRNRIRSLLEQLTSTNRLSDQEIYVLRNCAILIHDLVERVDDVSKLLHWITDHTFLDALANCLNHTNRIFKPNQNKNIIKQITRLLSLFCNIQERLPLPLHQTLFERLLQPTINCLTSTTYVKLFQNLKCDSSRLTEEQKLFLIRCPHFLTSYNGPFIERLIEQILEKMLPRYVSILNKHMKGVKDWHRPMMRAVHNLIITIIYAEDYFSAHVKNEPFRLLIDHLLQMLNEPTLVNKIHVETKNMESLLVDATLIVFSILVFESDALEYLKQRNAAETFRKLTGVPSETIVLNAYMLLAYTMSDNDIKTAQDDLSKLLSTAVTLLDKNIKIREEASITQNVNAENIDRNILQLVETLKGLAQHDQIKQEIINQGLIPVFYEYYEKLFGLSREVMLEFIWTLSFNEQIAQLLREHPHFIPSLQSIPRISDPNFQQNTIRRSHSYSSLRNSGFTVSNEATSNGIRKMADGILWKLVKESQFCKALAERTHRPADTTHPGDGHKHKYDILISYSYMDKDIVHRIQQYLTDHGLHVWLDRSFSHRKAMEIVAEAIEHSDVILLCMSDSYKRDNHSRIEAEYAFHAKRKLIALTLRPGFKPDGWLAPIFSHSTHIDFAVAEFKTTAKAILKEMKHQQQHKKKSSKTASASTTTQNPPILLPVVDKPQPQADFSRPMAVNTFNAPHSQPAAVQKSQQQSTPMTRYPNGVATPTHGLAPNNALFVGNKQQRLEPPMQFVSRSSTFGSLGSMVSGPFDKDQQQMSMRSLSGSPTLGSMYANPFIDGAAEDHSMMRKYAGSRSSTPGSLMYEFYDKEQQSRARSRSPTPGSLSGNAPTILNQPQYQELPQHSETLAHSISRSSTPGSVASVASGGLDKGGPDAFARSASRSPGFAINSSGMPPLVNEAFGKPHDRHRRSFSQSPANAPNRSGTRPLINEAFQQQHPPTPARSMSASPALSFFAADPTGSAADKQQSKNFAQTDSVALTPNADVSISSLNTDQRLQTTLTSVSQLPTPASGQSGSSFASEKQPTAPESFYSSNQPSMATSSSPARQPANLQHQQKQPSPPKGSTAKSPVTTNSSSQTFQETERRPLSATQADFRAVAEASPTPTLSNTAAPSNQQHQQSTHQTARGLKGGTLRGRPSMNGDTQRLSTQVQTLSRSSSSDSDSSDTSDTVDQLQTSRDQICQPSTQMPAPTGALNPTGKPPHQPKPQLPPPPSLTQSQNPQIPMYAAFPTTMNGIMPSGALNGNDKQRPQTQMRAFGQDAPDALLTSGAVLADQQLLQTAGQGFASSAGNHSTPTINFAAFDHHHRQQPIPTHLHPHQQMYADNIILPPIPDGFDRHLPTSTVFPTPQALNNGARPANGNLVDSRQNQNRRMLPIPRSATFDSIPTITDSHLQYQQPMQRHPDPRPLAYYHALYGSAPIVADMPPRASNARVAPRPSLGNNLPPIPLNSGNRQQQQQRQQINPYPTGLPPMRAAAPISDSKRQQPVIPFAASRSPTGEGLTSALNNKASKQQEQQTGSSMGQTSASGSTSMSSSSSEGGKRADPSSLSRVNSRPTSPVTFPVASTLKTVVPSVSNATGRSQATLPEEYTNRNTDNSSYRALSVNAWRPDDVLDFLSDLNLYQLMPLCEAMSGKALTRLFRMCQAKPSRLYDQLNDELRARYKSLTLPMGVYTQFLIEMDGLVGPSPDSLLSISPPRPNIVERVILAPRAVQQPTNGTQADLQLPTNSPDLNQDLSSIPLSEMDSRTTTPVSKRIIERAVFRPASAVGRPYDFIVESVEESTEILQQVARYGTEILALDELAPQHHEGNSTYE